MDAKIRSWIGKAVYNDHGQMIFRENNGGQHQFLDVRGWGAITKIFKTTEEMEAFQDAVGEWVADAINQKLAKHRNETEPKGEVIKICTGCGRLSTDPPIEKPALSCCPDNHYLTVKAYWMMSAFPANNYQKKEQ
jgi:hypothetical protein